MANSLRLSNGRLGYRRSVVRVDFLYDACGVPAHDDAVGHVRRDDGTGGDNRVVADSDTGIENRPPAEPDVVADGDGRTVLRAGSPLSRVDRVGGGVDVDTRSEVAVPADRYPTHVQHDAVEVRVEALANVDVVAVVAPERRFHVALVAERAEQVVQKRAPPVAILDGRSVVPPGEITRTLPVGHEFGVVGIVPLPVQHTLLFAAHTPELSATPNILAERRTDGRPGSFDSLNTLLRNRAHVIERIDTEVEMLERHLRVLRVVIRNEPIGIVQLAEELSIPDHKARYSLRVLEEEGLIEPTDRGATTTDDLGGYVDRANGRIDGLRERVIGLATDGESDEAADVVGAHASEP